MSGLVGYGSSSDEEDTLDYKIGNVLAEQSVENVTDEQRSSTQADAENADIENQPVVGPAGPPNLFEPTESGRGSPTAPDLQDMSERDAIRFLTQASHPMTSIPSSPPGSPDPAANAKFRRFLELKAKGLHFNEDLARKSSFRNPSLLPTMMARVGIEEADQYNTSLPPDLWNPTGFPAFAYKEELIKNQQMLRDKEQAAKKALSASGKRTIEFSSAGRSGSASRESTPGSIRKKRGP